MHPRIHSETRPDGVALIRADSGQPVTYRALELRANRAAHGLRRLGLGIGSTMALVCDNRPEFFDIYWAAQRAGVTLVPLSSRLKPDEIAYIVQDSGAKLLLISDTLPDTAQGVIAARAQMPDLAQVLAIGPIAGLDDWRALCASQPDTPIADEGIGSRMVYSSGTTGRPKGIRFPAASGSPIQPNPAAQLFGQLYALDSSTIYLCPAPLYHSAPMGLTVAVQALGGTSVVMAKFEPEEFLQAIERYRITAVMVVPTMFVRLLKLPDDIRQKYDLSSLKTVIHAAAPCPIPIKRAMIEWLGPIIEEFYAGSEGNGHVIINSQEWLERPGSVGRAILGEIHICSEDGVELPVGETGTIYFGGGKPFSYHNDAEKTRAAQNAHHPNWTTMGDVGHVDAAGYLYLSDRKDFMIISGGVNIYPQEVENLLITHPDVADAAVFGVPNADFGEEVKAVIQPARWADANPDFAARLIDWCRGQLADIKCPRSIDFDQALPRTETGKLFKKELKARYWPPA